MKIITNSSRRGRFFLGRKIQKNIEVLGDTNGFETYDEAEEYLSGINAVSTMDEVLILYVRGEFRARTTLVEVVPVA